MPLDPDSVGVRTEPTEVVWDARDCMLYALGVGAGVDDPALVTENTRGVALTSLPTMPVVLGGRSGIYRRFGTFDWANLVHAEQDVELYRPLPVEGRASVSTTVAAMYDKGSAALVMLDTEARDVVDGQLMFCTRATLFIREAGGWGGDRGPTGGEHVPQRSPDHEITQLTLENQALIYRLSGDRNPLHSDPGFARRAGFERPILHGLCTYGFAGRAVLAAIAKEGSTAGPSGPTMRSMRARFAAPVMPGDRLTTVVWRTGASSVAFETRRDDGTVVLSKGACVFMG